MMLAWPSCSSRRGARRAVAAALLGAAMLAAPAARAQQPSRADLDQARHDFRDGVACQAASNWTCALEKYMAVIKVKSTPQVAFNIAECQERLGKLTEALGNYRIAASQAENDKGAATVLKEVGARIDDLDARIPKLTIKRGRGADAATVELDGQDLGPSQLGAAMGLDPGSHTIVARMGDKEVVRETLTLAEKDQKTFVVKVDLPKPVVKEEPPPEPEAPPPAPSRVPGIVLTAGGGVLLITGLAMLGPRGSAISQITKNCPTGMNCPTSDESVASSGKLYTGLTEVFVPVGIAAAVVGIVMLVKSAPPRDEKKDGDGTQKKDPEKPDAFLRSLDVAPWAPGASVGGLSLTGRF